MTLTLNRKSLKIQLQAILVQNQRKFKEWKKTINILFIIQNRGYTVSGKMTILLSKLISLR